MLNIELRSYFVIRYWVFDINNSFLTVSAGSLEQEPAFHNVRWSTDALRGQNRTNPVCFVHILLVFMQKSAFQSQ